MTRSNFIHVDARRSPGVRALFCAIVTFVIGTSAHSETEVRPQAAPPVLQNASATASDSLGAWPYQPWENMKGGARHLFDTQNRWALGVGALALASARGLDEEANDYFAHKRRLGDADHLGNDYLGTGVPGVLLAAGFWIYGDLKNAHYETHAGQAQIESLFVTAMTVSLLKGVMGRERPDKTDHYSFPSGHTSTVFASAMALQEFYGWKAGAPAFALGALTAMSRMSDKRHWFSDTVGGALFGVVIAHAYSRSHLDTIEGYRQNSTSAASRFSWFPVVDEDGARLFVQTGF